MEASLVMNLASDATRAADLVTKLSSTEPGAVPKGTERMARSELHHCSGLGFTFVRKAGLGLAYERGHGFVIAKLPKGSAAANGGGLGAAGGAKGADWAWSAPLFITVNAGSFGLTLGFSEIESVVVLDTPEAVKAFANTQVEFDTDIAAAAGSSLGTSMPATAANFSHLNLSDKTFTYSICKGAIVDVSLSGIGYAVDAKKNQAIYGADVAAERVLDGGVPPPSAMADLYKALDKVLQEYYAAHKVGAPAGEASAPVTAEPVAPTQP